MNWVQINNYKFEIIKNFKYTGPLKSNQLQNYWSNTAYFSVTIKCPKNYKFLFTENFEYTNLVDKENDVFHDCEFILEKFRVVSTFKDHVHLKLELRDLKRRELPKNIQRDLKLTDLFEYNFS